MNLSPTAQATLLLTSYFSKASNESAKPLTNAEWGRFALWLKDKAITPAELLVSEPEPLLTGWHDSRVSVDRILQLLNRGHSLAIAVEKWQRAGLWVVTRSDPEYPKRLKSRLKTGSPPVLFGCGNKNLLNAGGLAVIGSRNASEGDLSFTNQVGGKAAQEGVPIVSGGARGVDEAAMLGSMNSGGSVIGIMADSLLKAATSAKWRKGLMDGHVVLISPFYPEAGFNAGNAMSRNKYIYCLADSSLVIHSGKKGGTLSGAEENLKKLWVPLWVKPTEDKNAANANLVAQGGLWCEENIQGLNVRELFVITASSEDTVKKEQSDLFGLSVDTQQVSQSGMLSNRENEEAEDGERVEEPRLVEDETLSKSALPLSNDEPVDFYQVFVDELARIAINPLSLDEMIQCTALHKSQLKDWLSQANDDGLVKKLSRPVRYQFVVKKKNKSLGSDEY
ncbi:MAG: DNA processing protein DprA [Gammaproteobacteria bacterium]|nr:MAG: DNA processing protein DprA [Gammaproteobacteria bacterium]